MLLNKNERETFIIFGIGVLKNWRISKLYPLYPIPNWKLLKLKIRVLNPLRERKLERFKKNTKTNLRTVFGEEGVGASYKDRVGTGARARWSDTQRHQIIHYITTTTTTAPLFTFTFVLIRRLACRQVVWE